MLMENQYREYWIGVRNLVIIMQLWLRLNSSNSNNVTKQLLSSKH